MALPHRQSDPDQEGLEREIRELEDALERLAREQRSPESVARRRENMLWHLERLKGMRA